MPKGAFTSEKQGDIWHLLRSGGAMTPTKIGLHFGKNYGRAASWACSSLKVLCRKGMARRLDSGIYEAI